MPFLRRRTLGQRRPPTSPALMVLLVVVSASDAATSWPGLGGEHTGDGIVVYEGLWIAADVTLEGKAPWKGPASVEVDDLSLLMRYEPTTRLALFTELRL